MPVKPAVNRTGGKTGGKTDGKPNCRLNRGFTAGSVYRRFGLPPVKTPVYGGVLQRQ